MEAIQEEQEQRCIIVWQCGKLKNENIRPGGNRLGKVSGEPCRKPREGCLSWNKMSSRHEDLPKWFQTSPCAHCGKRIRDQGLMTVFGDELQALRFIEEKRRGQ